MTKEAAAANSPLVDRPGCGPGTVASLEISAVTPDGTELLAAELVLDALVPVAALPAAALAVDALGPATALPPVAPQENSGSAIRAAAPWPLAVVDILSGMA